MEYQETTYKGQPARIYPDGAIRKPTGAILKPSDRYAITAENNSDYQEKNMLARAERKQQAISAGVRAAIAQIEPDSAPADHYEAAGIMAGWVTHIIAEGGNAGVKAYSELMKDLGLRDEVSVSVSGKVGELDATLSGISVPDLLRMAEAVSGTEEINIEVSDIPPQAGE